jgi:hypothetical protein
MTRAHRQGPRAAPRPVHRRHAQLPHAFTRRQHLGAVAGGLLLSLSTKGCALNQATPSSTRGTGRSGDFDFLAGSWRIKNRRLKQRWVPAAQQEWELFDGESTCWSVLGGLGSIEELRIPVGQPRGLGIRLLDVERGLWSDYWTSSASGTTGSPMWGTFEDGAGTFIATDDRDGDVAIHSRGVWDRITRTSCRWHQAFSRDGGKTWEDNWFMEWTRAA